MNKLNHLIKKLVEKKFPKADYTKILGKLGELLLVESIEIALSKLKTDRERSIFTEHFKTGRVEELFSICEKSGFNFEDILESKSEKLFLEFFKGS